MFSLSVFAGGGRINRYVHRIRCCTQSPSLKVKRNFVIFNRMPPRVQGRFRFREWTNWFGILGEIRTQPAPVIIIPGGPGATHHLLEPIARLTPPDRTLIYYDPTGAGASDRPTGVAWNLELFVDELEALRTELGLDRFHILGTSFGGTVGLAYALRRPPGLVSMTLAGASHSYRLIRELVRDHIQTLPSAPILLDPAFPPWGGRFSPAQAKAVQEYSSLFICRVALPATFARALSATNFAAMNGMKGPGFLYEGNLRDLDLTSRLGEIDIPVLISCGRHDVFFPRIYEDLQARLPRSRLAVFPMSSHMPQLEEEVAFARTMFGFLAETETNA